MLDVLAALRAGLAPHYTVEREIGAGGMARVFLASERHPPQGGGEGDEPGRLDLRVSRALHPGSRAHVAAQPPAHRADSRRGRVPLRAGWARGAVLLRDAVHRGRIVAGPPGARATAAA